MNRKAAIQLSLGFIVAVVFAVILLSLALTWVTNIFNPLQTITHKTTDIAMQRLLEELAATNKKVGIAAPAVTAWAKGETGSYALGIKNEDADQSNTYYINVYLEELGGELAGTPVSSLMSEVGDWISYSKAIDLEPLERSIVNIVIKPTVTAQSGIYHFRAAVCQTYDPECHATSPPIYPTPSSSLYGSASFAIEIKG